MFSFFVSYDSAMEAYSLTTAGYVAVVVILVGLLVGAAFLFDKNKNVKMSTKQLVFSAAALALAFALSYVKIVPMPWGGSITLCSMLFVCLVGYLYGPKVGILAALAYGLLQLLQDGGSYMIHPFQVFCDYIFSFAALGLSGFFSGKKNGLMKGYIVGIVGRFIFTTLGGYIYWMSYMPDSFPQSLSAIYPICYNGSYIFGEGIITVIIILIPAVAKAFGRVKKMALS